MRIETRLTGNRQILGEKVPLKQPYVLLVDPSNLCNLVCRFCPSGNRELIRQTKRKQKVLDFDIFCKIINDTWEFEEPIKVLRLYKEGEPLLNPKFADMVDYAKQKGNISRIDTTTNGLLFNKELNRKIIRAGIDQINISVNGVSTEQIEHYCRVKVDFEQFVEEIQDLYENRGKCEIFIKAIKENLTDEEQAKFFEVFGNISDKIYLERISPAWPDFCFDGIEMNFETGHYGQPIEDRKVCPYLFYVMVINSDGTVSTCVGDWRHKQLLGDVCKESVKDIWHGDIMRDYWSNHLTFNKDIYYMCERCEVVRYGSLDNLDNYADAALKRLQIKQYS